MAEKMKALERENRELRQANEILRKGEPVKAPLVQAHWRTHILRWRSSTAGRSDGGFHRRAPGCARGRADLRRAADRPVHLL
jgi:hypothetical protein